MLTSFSSAAIRQKLATTDPLAASASSISSSPMRSSTLGVLLPRTHTQQPLHHHGSEGPVNGPVILGGHKFKLP
ncbi:hypothetical protein ACFX13_024624 [Malus domestica]